MTEDKQLATDMRFRNRTVRHNAAKLPNSLITAMVPGTEEPLGLLSMGSHRVGH